jgi:F0F1-type ATP synthase epsilon subunit
VADSTFRCRVITPEDNVVDASVTYASVPMWDGQRGFMHATSALVGKLGFGELRLDFAQGGSKSWFIDSGFMQNVDDVLTILASGAVAKEELDLTEIKAELAEANARKSDKPAEMERITEDRQRATAKLMMASG